MAQLNQFAPPANQADLTGDDQTSFAHQWERQRGPLDGDSDPR